LKIKKSKPKGEIMMIRMSKKDEIALEHLRERIERLQKGAQPIADVIPHVPDVILGHFVASVVKSMFAYRPAAIANALYADGLCPHCAAALANAAQLPPMNREAAIKVLKQVVRGDLIENHIEVELAREALGSEAAPIEAELSRQYRELASSRDYMKRKHRVPGSAYSAQR
jgi:hypothetical protein